jgi:hypothetical protein
MECVSSDGEKSCDEVDYGLEDHSNGLSVG